jgi:2-iminoacetate synthase
MHTSLIQLAQLEPTGSPVAHSFVLEDYHRLRAEALSFQPGNINSYGACLLSRAAKALSVYLNPDISTQQLFSAAEEAVRRCHGTVKSTFVPIFTTNHCDSECLMCGMRKGNVKLHRKFSGRRTIEEQLKILYEVDQVRGVGFLTGEYEGEYVRMANAFLIGWAIRRALDMGFQLIYFNIGSLVPEEIEVLREWVEPSEPVTMCVFQETYDRSSYSRFMGPLDPRIPKADFDRRLRSFDNWLDQGFRHVNPGFLVGLHEPDVDLAQLAAHVDHLDRRGAYIRISLPRMRPALGTDARSKVPDDQYVRIIATIAHAFPEHPIVLTTRENEEFQRRVMPIVGVVSPGSPDVSPYRRANEAENRLESSQFLIPDHRRPLEILTAVANQGYTITHFAGPTS